MRRNLHRSVIAAFAALTLPGLASTGAAAAAQPIPVLRYGIDDEQNINRLPQVVAERQGFFAREGLKVDIVRFRSSFRAQPGQANVPTVRDAMDNGSIDMSRQQLALLINDSLTGRVKNHYVGVALAMRNPVYYLVVRPEIKTFADLRGKTVTLTGLADGITLWTRELIEAHGVPKNALTVKSIAGSEGRFACMKSGECVAASMAQPAVFDALAAGYTSLGTTNEIGPQLYQLDIANPAWAVSHRDTVIKYIRATTAAARYIQDPANREDVVKVTMELMGEPEDRARRMVAAVVDPKNRVLATQPEIDMENARATIALLGEYGILKQPLPPPERYVDPSYSRAAGQAGR
jgi:ABC-type nitrate/sulfonate/bicarbonate transport system substrate-binding protein